MLKKIKQNLLSWGIIFMVPIIGVVFSCSLTSETTKKNYSNWGDKQFIQTYNTLSYESIANSAQFISNINPQEETHSNVVYQLTVYSFADGNNDGIGDFIGLKDKLDYFKDIGIDQLYLSPIHPSSSYHGYDVIDYTKVAPELGGMKAFDLFLETAHNKGIKVYLDMVYNHTSYEHPWFQKALLGDVKYRKFYNFATNDKTIGDTNINSQSFHNNFLNIKHQKSVLDQIYISKFWAGMPDLNLDNPVVINELKNIQKFWTKKGVDGYRYDAFMEFFASPGETQNNFNIQKIFADLRNANEEAQKEINKDSPKHIYMFGEWWGPTISVAKYFNDGNRLALDSGYDAHHWKNVIIPSINAKEIENILSIYNSQNPFAQWMPFLDNHDEERWINKYRQKVLYKFGKQLAEPVKQSTINALQLALFQMLGRPANPIIYQGDDLGYHATKKFGDAGLREPMHWQDKKYNVDFYEKKSGPNTKIFLNYSKDRPNVDYQLKDKNSPIYVIKNINKLRQKYKWLGSSNKNTIGNPHFFIDQPSDLYTFIRQSPNKKDKLLFAYNFAGTNSYTLKTPATSTLFSLRASLKNQRIELKENSCIVLKI